MTSWQLALKLVVRLDMAHRCVEENSMSGWSLLWRVVAIATPMRSYAAERGADFANRRRPKQSPRPTDDHVRCRNANRICCKVIGAPVGDPEPTPWASVDVR